MNVDKNLIVVGAGIAGLSLSLGLAKSCPNFKLDVIESSQTYNDDAGTLLLEPNGMAALEALDPSLSTALREEHAGQNSEIALLMRWVELRNSLLKKCQELGNIHIHNSYKIQSISEERDCVEVRFSNSDEVLKGTALVGADGINSQVRQHLNLSPARETNITIWRGMCDTTNPEATDSVAFLAPLVSNGAVPVFLRLKDSILAVVNLKGQLCWTITTKQTINVSSGLIDLFPVGSMARGGYLKDNLVDYRSTSYTDLEAVELTLDMTAMLKNLFQSSTAVGEHRAKVVDLSPSLEDCCRNAEAKQVGSGEGGQPSAKRLHGLGQQWQQECTWPTRWGGTSRITLIGDAAHAFLSDDGQSSAMALEDAVVLIRHIQAAVEAGESSKKTKKRQKGSSGKSNSDSSSLVVIDLEQFESQRIPRVMRMHSFMDRRLVDMFEENGPGPIDKQLEEFLFSTDWMHPGECKKSDLSDTSSSSAPVAAEAQVLKMA